MVSLAMFYVCLSCSWLIVAASLESFITDQVTDVPYVERDEQINTLYNTWEGYGLDCYHHINQDMSLRLYFLGRVIAEAKVTSCTRAILSQSIVIKPYQNGRHKMRVCLKDSCNMYEFDDPQEVVHGVSDIVTKPNNKLPHDDASCVNEWCRFGELDEPLLRKIFFPQKEQQIN